MPDPINQNPNGPSEEQEVSFSVMPRGDYGKITPAPASSASTPATPKAPQPASVAPKTPLPPKPGMPPMSNMPQKPGTPAPHAPMPPHSNTPPPGIPNTPNHHGPTYAMPPSMDGLPEEPMRPGLFQRRGTYWVLGFLILAVLAGAAYVLLGPGLADKANEQPATRLPETFLQQHFGMTKCTDASRCGDEADPDNDGLENYDEFLERTIPVNNDSDADGLADGDEVNIYLTDPINKFTDKRQYVIDNNLLDGVQIKNSYDPLVPGTKMNEARVSKINEAIAKFKLHEPTISTLASTAVTPAPKFLTVYITNNKFDTSPIEININDTIVWLNKDTGNHQIASDPHPTHTDVPGLESGSLATNQTFSFKFTNAGTFGYHDHLNPDIKGTVIVK